MEMGAPLRKLDEKQLKAVLGAVGNDRVERPALPLYEYIEAGKLWAMAGHKKAQEYIEEKS